MKKLIIGCLMLLLSPLFAAAQVANNTALVGTVTDASGGVVPGVHITAVERTSKVSYDATTNEVGYYSISGGVLPGTYDISAEKNGFQRTVKSGVILTLNLSVRTDIALQVGSETTQVTVSANTETIQTDDSLLGETIPTQMVDSMPMNGRSALDIANIASNVNVPTGAALTGAPAGKQATGTGTRGVNNDVTLDGITIMDNLSETVALQPNPDAIESVQTQVGNYTAQYGDYIGVHINMSTRSGTNQFHGTTYDYLQNDFLNSRGFNVNPTVPRKTELRYNLFGGVVSGPVLIPHFYNGRDKTFFMASYEGLRSNSIPRVYSQAFTPAEEAGDFTALLNPTLSGLSKPNLIFSPIDGHAYYNPATGTQIIDDQAAANSPIVKNILAYAALANVSGANLSVNNYAPTPTTISENSSVDRIDQNIGDKIRTYGRYDWQRVNQAAIKRDYANNTYSPITLRNFGAGVTYIITPNFVNDLRGGFDWRKSLSLNYFYENGIKNADSALGIPAPYGIGQSSGDYGLPDIVAGNSFSVSESGSNWIEDGRTYEIFDQVSWTKKRHTIMAGVEVRRLVVGRAAYNSARGILNFSTSYTSYLNPSTIPSSICPGGTPTSAPTSCTYGSADATLYTGVMSGDTTPIFQIKEEVLQYRDGFFVQDSWQVLSKLTLELGLRYELPKVAVSANGYARLMDPTYTYLIPPSTATSPLTYSPNPGLPLTAPNHKDIGPRVGFAYRATNKITIRGGGGLYYNANQLNAFTLTSGNYPFSASVVYTSPTPGAETNANPYDTLSYPTAGASAAPVAGTPGTYVSAYSIANHLPSETMYQWNLDNGYELWKNAGLEVQYIGNREVHLNNNYYPNQPVPHPVNESTTTLNSIRPNQNFGQIRVAANPASASYNGVTAVLRQRLNHGLSANVSYTFAHALEESLDAQSAATCMIEYDCRADWGDASSDIRHKIVVSFTYSVPTLATHNALVQEALAGWQLNGIVTAQTGSPFNVSYGNYDWAYAGVPQSTASSGGPQRPNWAHRPSYTCSKNTLLGESYTIRNQVSCVDETAYSLNTRFTYGNLHRDDEYGPGAFTNNLSLFKNFKLHEETEFQLRAEAFNAFNHANLAAPGNISFNVIPTCNTSACFGTPSYLTGTLAPTTASSAFGYPVIGTNGRTIQIAGKINF